MIRIYLLVLVGLASVAAQAADWNYFRGPNRNGMTAETGFPLTWSQDENIRWKVELPGEGNGSPIVVGDRVLVTSAQENGRYRGLYCFDRNTGQELWKQVVEFTGEEPTHRTNPYCGSSPGSDGKRVVVWEGSAGVYCYDLDGKLLWMRDLGTFQHIWGYGSSPVFYKNRVLLNCGPGARQFVIALNADTGETIWQTDTPEGFDAEYPEATSNREKWIGSWATPLVARIDGRDQVIVSQPKFVQAYDPDTGEVIWKVGGLGTLHYTDTLISEEKQMGVSLGGFSGPGIGFRLGGQGDMTETSQLWRAAQGNPQRIGSGIILGDYVFMANEPGIAQCFELATGTEVWKERLPGGKVWGSLVHAEGRLYVTNQAGNTLVFAPSAEGFQLLAENKLDETSNSTPAFSNGQIFLRTYDHLYCIQQK